MRLGHNDFCILFIEIDDGVKSIAYQSIVCVCKMLKFDDPQIDWSVWKSIGFDDDICSKFEWKTKFKNGQLLTSLFIINYNESNPN